MQLKVNAAYHMKYSTAIFHMRRFANDSFDWPPKLCDIDVQPTFFSISDQAGRYGTSIDFAMVP